MGKTLCGNSVLFASLTPLFATKVQMWKPRLIYIDDSLTLLEKLEHLLGIQHPHD